MGAMENKVSLICFIPLDYNKLLQTNMSLGTAWICWGREYPSVISGDVGREFHRFGAAIANARFPNVLVNECGCVNRLISR